MTYPIIQTGAVQNAYVGYASYSLSVANTQLALVWPVPTITSQTVLAATTNFVVSAANCYVTMPSANEVGLGMNVFLINDPSSTEDIQIYPFSGNSSSQIESIEPGQTFWVQLTAYTTGANPDDGEWTSIQMGSSTSEAMASALAGYGIEATGATLSTLTQVKLNPPLTGSIYNVLATDQSTLLTFTGASQITVNIPAFAEFMFSVNNATSANVIFTCADTAATINGQEPNFFFLEPGQSCTLITDSLGDIWSLGLTTLNDLQSSVEYIDLLPAIGTSPASVTLTPAQLYSTVQIYFVSTNVSFTNEITVYYGDTTNSWIVSNITPVGSVPINFQLGTSLEPIGSAIQFPQNAASVMYSTTNANSPGIFYGVNYIPQEYYGPGSAESPSLSFLSDKTTGLYLPTPGVLGVAAGGVEVAGFSQALTFIESNTTNIGGSTDLSLTSPIIDLNGVTTVSGNLTVTGTTTLTTPLPLSSGGTGTGTPPTTIGSLFYAASTGAGGAGAWLTNPIATGQVLYSQGTGNPPAWLAPPALFGLGLSPNYMLSSLGSIPFWTATPLFSSLSLTTPLPFGSGGTASDGPTAAGQLFYASSISAGGWLSQGTAGQVLTSQGAGVAPIWAASIALPLPVTQGGTGVTSLAINGVLFGNGTGNVQVTVGPAPLAVLGATESGVPVFTGGASTGAILSAAPTENLVWAVPPATPSLVFTNTGAGVNFLSATAGQLPFFGTTWQVCPAPINDYCIPYWSQSAGSLEYSGGFAGAGQILVFTGGGFETSTAPLGVGAIPYWNGSTVAYSAVPAGPGAIPYWNGDSYVFIQPGLNGQIPYWNSTAGTYVFLNPGATGSIPYWIPSGWTNSIAPIGTGSILCWNGTGYVSSAAPLGEASLLYWDTADATYLSTPALKTTGTNNLSELLYWQYDAGSSAWGWAHTTATSGLNKLTYVPGGTVFDTLQWE